MVNELKELKFNGKNEITNLEGKVVSTIPIGAPWTLQYTQKYIGHQNPPNIPELIKRTQHPLKANAFVTGSITNDKYLSVAVQYYKIKE